MSVRTRATTTLVGSSPDVQARMNMERLYQIGHTQPMSTTPGTATSEDFTFMKGYIQIKENDEMKVVATKGFVSCELEQAHRFVVDWYYGSDSSHEEKLIHPKVVQVFVHRKVASFVVSELYTKDSASEKIKNTIFKLSDIVMMGQHANDVKKIMNEALELYTTMTGIKDECHSGHKTHTPAAPTPAAPTPAAPTPAPLRPLPPAASPPQPGFGAY